MGYHHCHIPDLEVLKKQFSEMGLEKFVHRYKNCQTLIGDTDANTFLESKISEWLSIIKSK
jgi:hypothetical protein